MSSDLSYPIPKSCYGILKKIYLVKFSNDFLKSVYNFIKVSNSTRNKYSNQTTKQQAITDNNYNQTSYLQLQLANYNLQLYRKTENHCHHTAGPVFQNHSSIIRP